MYIVEKRPLEEIMDYMKQVHNFQPSKRAFQTQFKKWEFPSKQHPAHKNAQLVARIRELWEQNTSQRDMLHILNKEDFDIKERELMRVRAKNRWLLRVPNGMKAHGYTEALIDQPLPSEDDDLDVKALQRAIKDESPEVPEPPPSRPLSPPLDPEVLEKRKRRLEQLQAESDERYAARKRRRRTRGWAGLPPDPPSAPRFPSETTIDESKACLDLDKNRYRELREHFQAICQDMGIIKKTIAGDDLWRAAKDRLVQENAHLSKVFGDEANNEQKALTLDVICTDVTKRMRTLERRMTIAEAKNIIGINPEQSRQIRNSFYNVLRADHFTSKLEAGEEHWKELKDEWIKTTPILQIILADEMSEESRQTKLKAMEVLCRDVMKRLRDDQTKRDPNRRSLVEGGTISPQPVAASTTMPPPGRREQNSRSKARAAPSSSSSSSMQAASDIASKALASSSILDNTISDLQIDPSLLDTTTEPSPYLPHHLSALADSPNSSYLPAAQPSHLDPNLDPVFQPQEPPPPPHSTPVYIRPYSISATRNADIKNKMWLAKLTTRTVSELRTLISKKYPNTTINRIDGIDKDDGDTGSAEHDGGGCGGEELRFIVDGDEELDAYLTHVEGRKAMFVVGLG